MRAIALAATLLVLAAACGGDDDGGTPDGGVRFDASTRPDGATPPRDAGAGTDGSVVVRDAGPGIDGGITFACSVEELQPIVDCAIDNCVTLPEGGLSLDAGLPSTDDILSCVTSNCASLLLGLSPDCQGCLLSAAGMNLDEILMSCAGGLPAAP